jgi:hypothetical protein
MRGSPHRFLLCAKAGLEAERSRDEPTSDRSEHDHYAENPKRLAPGHADLPSFQTPPRAWLLDRLELQTRATERPPN